MPKKRTQKRKKTCNKKRTHQNQAYKTINTGIRAATGIAALGITTNALTTIAKT